MWTKYDGQEGEILQIDKTVFDKQYLYLQFLIALVDMYLSFYLCGVNVGFFFLYIWHIWRVDLLKKYGNRKFNLQSSAQL